MTETPSNPWHLRNGAWCGGPPCGVKFCRTCTLQVCQLTCVSVHRIKRSDLEIFEESEAFVLCTLPTYILNFKCMCICGQTGQGSKKALLAPDSFTKKAFLHRGVWPGQKEDQSREAPDSPTSSRKPVSSRGIVSVSTKFNGKCVLPTKLGV